MIYGQWFRIIVWSVLLLSLDARGSTVGAASTSVTQGSTTTDRDECTLARACEMCTMSDQKDIPECMATGRRKTLTCVLLDDEDNEIGKRTKYQSCKRTRAEEEFRVVRLQVLCLLLGAVAVVSVRKQKMVSASLFDQRKLQAEQARKERERQKDQAQGIELASVFSEETVPLTLTDNNPSLEVV